MKNLKINEISANLTIIGGGVAGSMAAIRASKLVNRVVVVEKCDTRRSGCATTGVDHIWTYVPEFTGRRTLPKILSGTMPGGLRDFWIRKWPIK